MTDKKVTELVAIDALSASDLLLVIDDPSGTALSKKATFGQLATALGGGTTPIGQSVPVAYDAGNFVSNDVGTAWVVEAADQGTFEYMIVNKAVFFYYDLTGTEITGGSTVWIGINIPPAITPKPGGFYVNGALLYSGGVWFPAFSQAGSGGHIQLFRADLTVLAAGSVTVRGMAAWQMP